MINNVTCVILAGGKSSRMGRDKSFLIFYGKPLIEILINKLQGIFKDLIIIANNISLYKKYKIKTYADIIKESGPLGGIHAGLHYSKSKYNFIMACDMPFVEPGLIKFMSANIENYDLVVPKLNGRFEPLCAIYSKNCLKAIENQLSKNNLKVVDFFPQVKLKEIVEKDLVDFNKDGKFFLNINTPACYQAITG